MRQRRAVTQQKNKVRQQQCVVMIGGEEVACRVSASVRQSMRLQVINDGSIDLRIPVSTSFSDGLAFVQQHESWLVTRRLASRQMQQRWTQSVPILGQFKTVYVSDENELRLHDQGVWVPKHWQASDIQHAVEAYYRQHAREYFAIMIDQWWPVFATYAQKPQLRVKKMRTRWGSLSQRGYINMNCLLMAMEPDLIELVVVHELCHTRYFHHGPEFQNWMSELLPDWRERERRLHEQGRLLLSSP